LKVAVFGDIHGNISAFESFVKLTKDVDIHICLGDVVNYCPYSNECVDLLESLPYTIKILGNHEEAFIDGFYKGENPIARAFFEKAFLNFNRVEEISRYKISHVEFGFTFIHTILDKYIYPDSGINFDTNYMVGHSHRQFKLVCGKNVLYNPGSIGQNRVNIEEGQYLILTNGEIEMKSFKVDIVKVIKEMKALGYSEKCTEYFLKKRINK
jgi:predicted phosphodiesterase